MQSRFFQTASSQESIMNKLLVTTLTLAAFSLPAFAATDYYVVKDDGTKKCMVSETKPDGKKMMMIGKDMFKTKAEAETALKAATDCK
jgi:hypothetical protein